VGDVAEWVGVSFKAGARGGTAYMYRTGNGVLILYHRGRDICTMDGD
jgi:hypothetical protein